MPLHQRTVRFAVAGILVGAAAVWAVVNSMHQDPVAVLVQNAAMGNVESVVANTRAGTVNACRRAKLAPTSIS